jgi:hypothetical protein
MQKTKKSDSSARKQMKQPLAIGCTTATNPSAIPPVASVQPSHTTVPGHEAAPVLIKTAKPVPDVEAATDIPQTSTLQLSTIIEEDEGLVLSEDLGGQVEDEMDYCESSADEVDELEDVMQEDMEDMGPADDESNGDNADVGLKLPGVKLPKLKQADKSQGKVKVIDIPAGTCWHCLQFLET